MAVSVTKEQENGVSSRVDSYVPTFEESENDPKLDRTLRWKRDLLLLSILGPTRTIAFLDRGNIANARIEGMEKSLNMPANGYSVAFCVLFGPYFFAEVISNLLLNRRLVRPNVFLGLQVAALGILGTCQGVAGSYGALLGIRILMGAFEAALPAAAAFIVALYYTKEEASIRFAFFFMFGQAGPLFSGFLAYAIEGLDGVGGREGWRWIFIIEGLITIVWAPVMLCFIPDFPELAPKWFLKPHEKKRLLAMLSESRGSEESQKFHDSTPLWKILTDWRIHLFTICFFCLDLGASTMAAFLPTILNELDWKASKAQLMTMPIWATAMLSTWTVTMVATKARVFFPFMVGGACVQIIGFAMLIAYLPNVGARYAALFFVALGTFPQMPLQMGWLSANLKGRRYLAVGMGWMIGFGTCANFITANVFMKSEAPRYPTGFSTGLAFTLLGLTLNCIGFSVYRMKNRRREAKRAEMSVEERERDDHRTFNFSL